MCSSHASACCVLLLVMAGAVVSRSLASERRPLLFRVWTAQTSSEGLSSRKRQQGACTGQQVSPAPKHKHCDSGSREDKGGGHHGQTGRSSDGGFRVVRINFATGGIGSDPGNYI